MLMQYYNYSLFKSVSDGKTIKKVFLGKPNGRRARRPKLRWLDCIENDWKSVVVKIWGKRAETQICMGYHSEGDSS